MSTRMETAVGFITACLIIGTGIVASNWSAERFLVASDWMVHTVDVRSEISEMTTQFLTAQNNIRGYHMSLQDYYLDLYRKARGQVEKSLTRLRELVSDNPDQLHNLDKVAEGIKAKFEAWDQSLVLRHEKGFEAIRDRLRRDESKSRDLGIFSAIDTLERAEAELYSARIARAKASGQYAKNCIAFAGVLAIGLILVATFMVFRDNHRLQVAEEKLDRFFTLSLDLLCISGMDGFFKRLSPSYADVLGYPLSELYRRPILELVHPDDVEKTAKEIERQKEGQKVLAFENRFRAADGTYRTFSWKSVPVGDLMYAVARDVTHQKEYESELRTAREQAQAAAAAKAAFLANMSHEIRTPLNGVVGMTDLLARTDLKLEQRGFVTGIRSSATILLGIVNEILDFSKIEAGRVKLESLDFDLAHLIESRISLIGVAAAEKGIRIETSVDPAIPQILRGDAVKYGQVLLNLLSNAVKFSDKGTIRIQATLDSHQGRECVVRLRVVDQGIGMDLAQKVELFEPFVQVESSTSRRFGGTGLGLSICKRLVEMMGGEIRVQSEPGKGSTFEFTARLGISDLPAVAAPEKVTVTRSELTAEQRERRKAIHILIAEDNRINQVVTMGMLKALGFTASLAENGKQAVELYAANGFDIILMDHQMPVMDGIEAAKEIRAAERGSGRRVPIIGFSATVMQEQDRTQFKGLIDDFVLKPVTLEILESVLSDWETRLT